jgi:hypothetical protein
LVFCLWWWQSLELGKGVVQRLDDKLVKGFDGRVLQTNDNYLSPNTPQFGKRLEVRCKALRDRFGEFRFEKVVLLWL